MDEKELRGLKSINDTIRALLAEAGHNPGDVLEPTAEEEAPEGEQKRRKIKVVAPFFSLEEILKRDGMLKYLTGVSIVQFRMLLEFVAEVREPNFFFVFLPSSTTAAVFVVVSLLTCVS